jgi:hypothetical protein
MQAPAMNAMVEGLGFVKLLHEVLVRGSRLQEDFIPT